MFADMVREIVRQIKLNPTQIPAVPIVYRRNNMDKVSRRLTPSSLLTCK